MKIVELEQGSEEWLSWRKTVITATDCPAILGSSPWSTAYKCWERKLGMVPEQKSNEAMERGKRLEPEAREQFIQRFGINISPQVVESSEYDFLGASLDGISDDKEVIVEIKCGGYNLHSMALQGIIPDYYMHQMQHQLLVTGAKKCFYYSYDGKDGKCLEVSKDEAFLDKFLPKAREFWRCIAFNEAPELQPADFKDMNQDRNWKSYAASYNEISEKIKELEERKKDLRNKLIELCCDTSCRSSELQVIKMNIKGLVDYSQIPELKNVDLDKYRKSSTCTWKILPRK